MTVFGQKRSLVNTQKIDPERLFTPQYRLYTNKKQHIMCRLFTVIGLCVLVLSCSNQKQLLKNEIQGTKAKLSSHWSIEMTAPLGIPGYFKVVNISDEGIAITTFKHRNVRKQYTLGERELARLIREIERAPIGQNLRLDFTNNPDCKDCPNSKLVIRDGSYTIEYVTDFDAIDRFPQSIDTLYTMLHLLY